jgi:hypothetical protein
LPIIFDNHQLDNSLQSEDPLGPNFSYFTKLKSPFTGVEIERTVKNFDVNLKDLGNAQWGDILITGWWDICVIS